MDERVNEFKIITFRLGDEHYGVDITSVREINSPQAVTGLPGTASAVLGVIDMRGQVVPIVDLRIGLGVAAGPIGKTARIMVLEINGRTVGCLVDAVDRVVTVSREQVQPPPDIACQSGSHVTGIIRLGERLVILLDVSEALERTLSA